MSTFSSLGLCGPVVSALEKLNYVSPTPIQDAAIPHVLAGRDVLASAQTGSGKTAAYGLPIIECLLEQEDHVRALIISPTRELCSQTTTQFELFGADLDLRTIAVYGGT